MGISQQIGASSIVKWGTCTSSTRPASPYEGQHIYETDTDIEYVWNGSAWVVNYVSAASPAFTGTPTAPTATAGTNTTQIATMASKPWNVAWGVVAYTNNATTTITGGILVGLNTTYTFQANRYYKISTSNGWSITGNILLQIHIDGTQKQRYFDSRFATRGESFLNTNGFWVGTVAAGSKQVTITVNTLSGTTYNTGTSVEPNQLIIEDLGPA